MIDRDIDGWQKEYMYTLTDVLGREYAVESDVSDVDNRYWSLSSCAV